MKNVGCFKTIIELRTTETRGMYRLRQLLEELEYRSSLVNDPGSDLRSSLIYNVYHPFPNRRHNLFGDTTSEL